MQQAKKAAFTYIFIFIFIALLFFEGEALSSAAKDALAVCAASLIPSLFPYLILSELIVSSGAGERAGRLLSVPAKAIFGISGAGASAFFLGALCGFPIGARSAVLLYEKKAVSKKEAEHLLCFCNNTGAGFLIAGVGAAFFGNRMIGVVLFFAQLISALLIGRLTAPIFKSAQRMDTKPHAKTFDAGIFTNAVGSATKSMLYVCGYVVFFSSLTGGISALAARFLDLPLLSVFVAGILEISSGCLACAKLASSGVSPAYCITLCAFFVGWSGMSVHAQTAAVCKESGLSIIPYVFAKFLQGLISAAIAALFFSFSPENAVDAFASAASERFYLPFWFSFAVNITFIFAILKKLIKKCGKKSFCVIQ